MLFSRRRRTDQLSEKLSNLFHFGLALLFAAATYAAVLHAAAMWS